MDKKRSLDTIIPRLVTKTEADSFLAEIDALSESLFTNKIDPKEKIKQLFPSEIASYVNSVWTDSGVQSKNRIELQNVLTEIKDVIKHTPVLNITIAFKPKQTTTQRIYNWVQSRIKTPVLLHIKVERQIIGGAIIEFHGKYFEYSLHKLLVETLHNG